MSVVEKSNTKINTYKKIRSFVMRSGRMTESQQRDYKILKESLILPYEGKPITYSSIFPTTNKVIIEIGFGMGHATIEIAKNNPDINYIGIEVHRPGVGRVLKEINQQALSNLCIIEHDAVEVLNTMIPNNSVQGFHIFFPDPWSKQKHHKRRLLKHPFTSLLADKLSIGGYIYMATDWKPYAEYALKEFSLVEKLHNPHTGFAPQQKWRPETGFEKKGKKADRAICELVFEKH